MIRLFTGIAIVLIGPVAGAPGSETAETGLRVRTVEMTLSPAAEPKPALKYLLLPDLPERKPGNAAPLYYRAALILAEQQRESIDKIKQWVLETPLSDLPTIEDVRRHVFFDALYEESHMAARREQCDWNLPTDTQRWLELRLPETHRMRELGIIVTLKARLHIRKDRIDEAIETLKTGFAMARDISEASTLVNALVGVAIAKMMSDRVEELVQQHGAPNLYWALTALPRPLIDTRAGLEFERWALYGQVPILRKIEEPLTKAEIQELTDQLSNLLGAGLEVDALGRGGQANWKARLAFTTLVMKTYAEAKQFLIAEGRSTEEVETMPVVQVVAIYSFRRYEELRDELFKWSYVPYPQAKAGSEEAERQLEHEVGRFEALPFARLFLPAISASYSATVRLDQQIAMLQCVEAIRIYAAGHDGQLPPSLADITEVPIPVDPATGNEFSYRIERDKAVLEGAPLGSYQARYVLSIRR